LLVLVAVEPDDTVSSADKLLHKLLNYRVFSDAEGKMNLSLKDVGGGLLLVSQFTLAADTKAGCARAFDGGPSGPGRRIVRLSFAAGKRQHGEVASGRFGADMQVHLVNDGPVTFMLQMKVKKPFCRKTRGFVR
jgi:D-tyrosyl-tRNA(Tyr) deacylase